MAMATQTIPLALPQIQLSVDIEPMVKALQTHMRDMPGGPYLYQRARRLVVIAKGIKPSKWLSRAPESPVITRAHQSFVRQLAAKAATCITQDKKGNAMKVLPPAFLIETLCEQPEWDFPVLDGIVSAPTLCPNGTVLTQPGYHEDSRLYMDTNGTVYPPLPIRPQIDDAHDAIERIHDVFDDFPFAEAWHVSATLAALLSLVARYAILGQIPMFTVNSNTPGTGKGLLIDTISTIVTGHRAPSWAQTNDDAEMEKQLMTIALSGDLLVHIDNVTETLGSGPLHRALTSESVTGRLLGLNEERTVLLDTIFFTSGNNISYRDDMVRRMIPIELDTQLEHPEERNNFAKNPLLPWVLKQRAPLLIDAMTILLAYFEKGKPAQHLSGLGSFQEWSNLVRSALTWAGQKDPCEGRKLAQQQHSPDTEALQNLLEAWFKCYDTRPMMLNKVDMDLKSYVNPSSGTGVNQDWVDLWEAMIALDAKWNGRTLNLKSVGRRLLSYQGRRLGDKRFAKGIDSVKKVATWRIEKFTTN
jgi:hypothetical protein